MTKIRFLAFFTNWEIDVHSFSSIVFSIFDKVWTKKFLFQLWKNEEEIFRKISKIRIFEKVKKSDEKNLKKRDVFSGSLIFWKSSSHKGKTSSPAMSLFTREKAMLDPENTGKNRDNLDTRRTRFFPRKSEVRKTCQIRQEVPCNFWRVRHCNWCPYFCKK